MTQQEPQAPGRQVSAYITYDLLDKIREYAERDHRTLSNQIRHMLEKQAAIMEQSDGQQ